MTIFQQLSRPFATPAVPTGALNPAAPRTRAVRAGLKPAPTLLTLAAALVTGLILLVPAYLLYRSAGAGRQALDTLLSARTFAMLGTTIGLAAAVTAASTVLAVALAWLTAATDLPGRRFWAVAAGLPLILPSYVAAYVYVSLLSPKGLVQQLLAPL